jgi:peroxiredoxin Q/BCP
MSGASLSEYYVVGPAGDIVLAYEGVDPEDHPDEVLADLDAP